MAKEYCIFISSNGIQLLNGSCDKSDMIKINEFETYPFDEGAMINGVITDDAPLLKILEEIKTNGIKQARVVIDSGQIITRNVDVPFLNHRELKKVIQDELASVDDSYEDLVYDFSVLRQSYEGEDEKQGGEILCCGVERKLIGSYIDLFESVGIKIKSIDIALNCLNKLTQEISELQNTTYIVSVLDGNNVSSYLFENNQYTFSNRTRLFSERGTPEFASEMISNISQLIQFSRSKKSKYAIGCAYFCGLDDKEEEQIFSSIHNNLSIEAQIFPNSSAVYDETKNIGGFQLHDYIYVTGCLLRK